MAPSPLQTWKFEQLTQRKLHYLYHLTHIDNLASILKYGLLPWDEVHSRGIKYTDISMKDVQARRDSKRVRVSEGRTRRVHGMVPLFIRPKTPMLFKLKSQSDDLCFVLVSSSYITRDDIDCVLCDGNIASDHTRSAYTFGHDGEFLDSLPWGVLNSDRWTDDPDGSRKRGAEFLVWPRVIPSGFYRIRVNSSRAAARVNERIGAAGSDLRCEIRPEDFFGDTHGSHTEIPF